MKVFFFIFLMGFSSGLQASKEDFPKLKVSEAYANAAYAAIAYYPELKNVPIEIVCRNIRTTMAARPRFFSIFGDNRKYRIYIDTRVKNNNGILLSNASYDAQVGIFGHEFAHILDYEKKTGKEVVYDGFRFLARHNIASYEKYIDYITIDRGLGFQLREWADFVLNKSEASESYKSFKKKHYFNEYEIDRVIRYCAHGG